MRSIIILCAVVQLILCQGGLLLGVAVPPNITDTVLNLTQIQPLDPVNDMIQIAPVPVPVLPVAPQPIPVEPIQINPAHLIEGPSITPQVMPMLVMNASDSLPVLNGTMISTLVDPMPSPIDPNPAAISFMPVNQTVPVNVAHHHILNDTNTLGPAPFPANWTTEEDAIFVSDTVDAILGEVNMTSCGRETLDYIFSKDLNPGTVRSVLKGLRNEVDPEEQDTFMNAAAKLDGLYRKRKRLIGELIDMSEATPEEAEQMNEYLKTLKVTSILNEVKQDSPESNVTTHVKAIQHNMKGWGQVLLGRRNQTLHHYKNTANVLL